MEFPPSRATDEAIREMIRDSDGTAFDKMRSINQELTFQYAQDFFSKSGWSLMKSTSIRWD